MTRCALADVIDERDITGTVSRSQLELAIEVSDALPAREQGSPGDLIDGAVDAGVLEPKYDVDDYPADVAPDRHLSFEVVSS